MFKYKSDEDCFCGRSCEYDLKYCIRHARSTCDKYFAGLSLDGDILNQAPVGGCRRLLF